jgi:hypothetical protein
VVVPKKQKLGDRFRLPETKRMTTDTTSGNKRQAQTPPPTGSSTLTTGNATNNVNTGGSCTPSAKKKKPYRRTKRPAGYNDKSSITVATDTFSAIPNVYDSILAESSDLLQAAAEAQQLGRLKMASAYMLLAHARLVGLGKRFDKAKIQEHMERHSNANATSTPRKRTSEADLDSPSSTETVPKDLSKLSATVHSLSKVTVASSSSNADKLAPVIAQKQEAASVLAEMLPPDIEMDTSMMEHLARAAAELHAVRSGQAKAMPHHSLPIMLQAESSPSSLTASSSHPHVKGPSQHRLPSIWMSPTAREFLSTTGNSRGVTSAASMAGVARLWNPVDTVANDDGPNASGSWNNNAAVGLESEIASSSSSRKKPVTAAMNTVPYAVCDARVLLSGGPLSSPTTAPPK